MKYKIEKIEERRFIINLTVEVEDIIKRLAKEDEEDFQGMTSMGMVVGRRVVIDPRKDLEGVEEICPASRYSFMVLTGKAFENIEVIRNVMDKLDCDIDLDDEELEASIEVIEKDNENFLSRLEGKMEKQKEEDNEEEKDNKNPPEYPF